jgi:hypothetical protein
VSRTDPELDHYIGINFMLRFDKIKRYAFIYLIDLAIQFFLYKPVVIKLITLQISHCTGQNIFSFHRYVRFVEKSVSFHTYKHVRKRLF